MLIALVFSKRDLLALTLESEKAGDNPISRPSIGQGPLRRILMALICTALEPLIDWIDSPQICLGVNNGPKIKKIRMPIRGRCLTGERRRDRSD